MGALLLSYFRVTNVKLINEENSLKIAVSEMTWTASFYYVFLYLVCFVVHMWHLFDYARF